MNRILLPFLLVLSFQLFGQSPEPPSDLEGEELRQWFYRNTYTGKHTTLGYSNARRSMYGYIDNKDDTIYCVYGGYAHPWPTGSTSTNPAPINCEHTVPQSFFGEREPMRSDIHHLFPTYDQWNSRRGSYSFDEIDDAQTTEWMVNRSKSSSIPTTEINTYSEYANSVFEPREDHKGNLARAIFYFFTMYPTQAGEITSVADVDLLLEWNAADPVDEEERLRNDMIEEYQGNRNPYIDYPQYADDVFLGYDSDTTSTDTTSNNGGQNGEGATGLFISEYIEGSSFNKAIEIANFTGTTIDLSSVSLKRQINSSGEWSDNYNLSGSLNSGEVYVIAHTNASENILSMADVKLASGAIDFNGNDPVGLFVNDILIDVVGDFNSGSTNFAKDQTLIRKPDVFGPNTTYTTSEWTVLSANSIENLGVHNFEGTVTNFEEHQENLIVLYPNPVVDSFCLEAPNVDKVELIASNGFKFSLKSQGSGCFDLSNVATGFYVVRIYSNGSVTETKIQVR